ncbi:MAG: hypothetical protein EKK53_22080 [Burkholderiales bacterium]|nr:MAG: hypothetical protein EKK53_22080 [Burkholderiales bacterium]
MHRRALAFGLASGLLAFAALPARADDEGEFLILHARYGTENAHVDVTARLKDLARQDRRFRLTNDLFGVDPDPGRTKTLRIYARDRNGREQQFDYRERDWVDGAQFIGWGGGRWGDGDGWSHGWHGNRGDRLDDGEYLILYATYGASGRDVDVTARLRDLARSDQQVRLTNDLFGVDPYPGQTKILRIFTRDRAGQQRTFEYREYQTIDGNQFIGWGGGDWGRDSDRGPQRPVYGRFVIESASYGNDGRWVDVTQAVRAQVRGDRLDVQVRNELFGVDPAPGQRKVLRVTYRVGNEPSNTVRVSERDTMRLP